MKKITYRPVYNRNKRLKANNTALLQVEAYLEGRKIYFSSHIYLTPDQWDNKRHLIKEHPHADELNMMLREFILKLEKKELELWKNGYEITLDLLKEKCNCYAPMSFIVFAREFINASNVRESTKRNRMTTCSLIEEFRPGTTFRDVDSRFVFEFERYLYNRKSCALQRVFQGHKKDGNFFASEKSQGYTPHA